MAAVTPSAGEVPEWWAERNNKQAAQLLNVLAAAKPVEKMAVPALPHVGGDHLPPQGWFVGLLFGPFVWPVDSETQLAEDSVKLRENGKFVEETALEAKDSAKQVFDNYWTAGKGAEAAEAAYMQAVAAKLALAEVYKVAWPLVARLSNDVERTKRLMAGESDAAHREAEAFLRSGSGQSIAQVAVILSQHRTAIQAHSAELHGHVAQDTLLFTDKFPLSPGDGPHVKQAGNGTTPDPWTDSGDPSAPPAPGHAPSPNGGGPKPDAWSDGPGRPPGLGGTSPQHWSDAAPPPGSAALPSMLSSGTGLPRLPSMPSGGSAPGFPLSLLSGFGGFPGAGMPPTAGLTSPAGMPTSAPSLPSLGADLGRGLAAGAAAAGGVAPVPQAPITPLAAPAPVESAPASAAPASSALAPPSSAPAVAPPATPAGGGLAPYGSVVPPVAPSAPASGSVPAAPSVTAEGGGPAAAGPAAGVMPVAGRRDGSPVRRDLAESDLELARMVVAELAGASSVVDAGLDWAVAVGRNQSSGMTTLWVATNDGSTYIPPGVYLRKSMPIAAGFNEEFDAHWFGWVNPAEKAVRAAAALGEVVGAVATTWGWPSEYLKEEHKPAVREIAIGVPHAGCDSPAAELLQSRSHRLQTVDAALYADLKAADESAVRDYCRELVRRLAFSGTGDELSPVAQSVAHTLVARKWPKLEEWAALSAEYDTALVLMGAQRPGLNGVFDEDQRASYAKLFVNCRRLEALLCWERFGADLCNVVYAAWVAGVRASLNELVLR